MDTALQRLAQVKDLGVAGKDLSKHDENIPDVGVISRLQAVNGGLNVAETENMSLDKKHLPQSCNCHFPDGIFNNNNKEGQLTLVSM